MGGLAWNVKSQGQSLTDTNKLTVCTCPSGTCPVSRSSAAEGFLASQGHAAACPGASCSDTELQAIQIDPQNMSATLVSLG